MRSVHWPVEYQGIDLQEKVRGRERDLDFVVEILSPILEHYQAVSDVPIPALYDRLAIQFPQAKFLFFYRNPFDWIPSVRWNQRNNREFRPYVRAVYWKYFDWHPPAITYLSDVQLLWMYTRHMADVIAYFQKTGPDRLGIFDLNASNNTEKISGFLGVKPRVKFPHVGQRPRDDVWQSIGAQRLAREWKPAPER
jgi:hypothetical protein